jgi:hypothetical protein
VLRSTCLEWSRPRSPSSCLRIAPAGCDARRRGRGVASNVRPDVERTNQL